MQDKKQIAFVCATFFSQQFMVSQCCVSKPNSSRKVNKCEKHMKWIFIVLLIPVLSVSESLAESLKDRLNSFSYASNSKASILNPTLDNKSEILRKFPSIALDANKIIEQQGFIANTSNDFHTLIYYLYLIDQHKKITELLSGPFSESRDYGPFASDYLDVIYLLPAMFHERIGQYNLANAYYHRYFSGMKVILSKDNRYDSREFALKMTLTRIKMMSLNRGWRPPSKGYYAFSYFSFQQDSLFSRYTRSRGFLKKYQNKGLFRGRLLETDHKALGEAIDIEDASDQNLFNVYELCAMALYVQLHPYHYTEDMPDLQIQEMKNAGITACESPLLSNIESNHPVFALYNFTAGRVSEEQGKYVEATNFYQNVSASKAKESEFLKDDAEFHQAIVFSKQGLKKEYVNKLKYIINNFSDRYDSVVYAKRLLARNPKNE
jgi:hypothetical protein